MGHDDSLGQQMAAARWFFHPKKITPFVSRGPIFFLRRRLIKPFFSIKKFAQGKLLVTDY